MPRTSTILALIITSAAAGTALAADPAATQPLVTGIWGQRAGSLQSKLSIAGEPAKAAPLHVIATLHNTSDATLPAKKIRVWLMLAQGQDLVFYTAPFTADPKTLDAGQQIDIPFDAATLDAFKYSPDIQIKDGLPTSASAAALPVSAGKVADILPAGTVKLKAFVVVSQDPAPHNKTTTELVASGTVTLKVAELAAADLAHLDAAGKAAFFTQLADGFHGNAVAAKNAHDRALKLGQTITPQLLALLQDDKVSSAGQMWLAATLVDLRDPHAIDALINILQKGGPAAHVVAYRGPQIKDEKLDAAIQKAAASTKDPELTAWALRGLGLSGQKTDPDLLQTMVTHSDPAGRSEAADILAAHPDPKAVPLLADLIHDTDPTVRVHAIQAAVQHHINQPAILEALRQAAQSPDLPTKKAATEALQKLAAK